jgi:hypothetical protein
MNGPYDDKIEARRKAWTGTYRTKKYHMVDVIGCQYDDAKCRILVVIVQFVAGGRAQRQRIREAAFNRNWAPIKVSIL